MLLISVQNNPKIHNFACSACMYVGLCSYYFSGLLKAYDTRK